MFCDTHGLLANLDICAVFIVIAAGSNGVHVILGTLENDVYVVVRRSIA